MTLTMSKLAKPLSQLFLLAMVSYVSPRALSQMGQIIPTQVYSEFQPPIAISALPSGLLPILESRGGLLILNPTAGSVTRIKETLGNVRPLDLVASVVDGQEYIFVTMYWAISTQSSGSNQALVVQYSLQGEEVHRWAAWGQIYGGVSLDQANRTFYIADAGNANVLTLAMEKGATPSVLAHVNGASRLGALVLDTTGHRLFVSDPDLGNVYALDLVSRRSKTIASGLGDPAALTYGPTEHKLYVADAAKHTIWQIPVDAPVPKLSAFSTAHELREPRGVAMGSGNNLWVADYGARAIFQLSPGGQVVRSFRR